MEEASPAEVIRAVNHKLRRRILRQLHASEEPLSPSRISQRLPDPLSTISYHVKVLKSCGTVVRVEEAQVRGVVEHFYASLVADDPTVNTLLDQTRDSDGDQDQLSPAA